MWPYVPAAMEQIARVVPTGIMGFIVFIDNGAGTGTADNDDRDGDEEVVKVYDYSGPNTLEFTDSDDNALSSLRFNGRGQLANGIEATF